MEYTARKEKFVAPSDLDKNIVFRLFVYFNRSCPENKVLKNRALGYSANEERNEIFGFVA